MTLPRKRCPHCDRVVPVTTPAWRTSRLDGGDQVYRKHPPIPGGRRPCPGSRRLVVDDVGVGGASW